MSGEVWQQDREIEEDDTLGRLTEYWGRTAARYRGLCRMGLQTFAMHRAVWIFRDGSGFERRVGSLKI